MALTILPEDVLDYSKQFMTCFDIVSLSHTCKRLNTMFKCDCKMIDFSEVTACTEHSPKDFIDCLKTLIECPFTDNRYKLIFDDYGKHLRYLPYLLMLVGYIIDEDEYTFSLFELDIMIKKHSLEQEKEKFMKLINNEPIQNDKSYKTIESRRRINRRQARFNRWNFSFPRVVNYGYNIEDSITINIDRDSLVQNYYRRLQKIVNRRDLHQALRTRIDQLKPPPPAPVHVDTPYKYRPYKQKIPKHQFRQKSRNRYNQPRSMKSRRRGN